MLQSFVARIQNLREVSPQILHLVLSLEEPNRLHFQAGQYVLMEIPGGFRQYSITSNPSHTNSLELVIDTSPQGPGSKYLLQLKVGETIKFRAPLGMFVLKENLKAKYFLATGAGIAPMRAMIYELLNKNFPKEINLLWGLKKPENSYFLDSWEAFSQQSPQFNYTLCYSQEKINDRHCFFGHIQEKLKNQNFDHELTEFYLCGRQTTVDKLQEFLIDRGVKKEDIHFERFT